MFDFLDRVISSGLGSNPDPIKPAPMITRPTKHGRVEAVDGLDSSCRPRLIWMQYLIEIEWITHLWLIESFVCGLKIRQSNLIVNHR